MEIPLVGLKRQYLSIKHEVDNSLFRVAKTGKYINSDFVLGFEKIMAQYIGVKYAISCASGTDAITLALESCGVGEGDEVITTPFTFFATVEAILRVGAKPVFVDIELDTFNIDPKKVDEKISRKTKAILPVHIFGNPCEIDEINKIAKKNSLYVIEDACQALGAETEGKKIGSLATAGCFSFFPTKNLGGMGDGGLIATDNNGIYKHALMLRSHGARKTNKYYNEIVGYNSRLDELQASILSAKFKYLNEWVSKRREIASCYDKAISEIGIKNQKILDSHRSAYNIYTIVTTKRDELASFLSCKGIETAIYYPIALHLQKALSGLGYRIGDFPAAEYLSKHCLSIPIFPELKGSEVEYIIKSLKEFSYE